MKLSFAITVKNEGEYIRDLLEQLVPYCQKTGDEIVVLDDYSTDEYTLRIFDEFSEYIKLHQHALDGDFATHKNYLTSLCSGEYIIQVDADEKLHDNLLEYLHDIIENNTNVDLFLVPRVNVVTGLTDDDIRRWGWQVNEYGWVMFPDFQTRIFKNRSDIRWEGKVHERIVGYKTVAELPAEEEWALYHIKDIERQRKQNAYYETL